MTIIIQYCNIILINNENTFSKLKLSNVSYKTCYLKHSYNNDNMLIYRMFIFQK